MRLATTLLAALNIHPCIAMRILHHSDVKVTMEIFTEAADEVTIKALRKLGGVLESDEEVGPGERAGRPVAVFTVG